MSTILFVTIATAGYIFAMRQAARAHDAQTIVSQPLRDRGEALIDDREPRNPPAIRAV